MLVKCLQFISIPATRIIHSMMRGTQSIALIRCAYLTYRHVTTQQKGEVEMEEKVPIIFLFFSNLNTNVKMDGAGKKNETKVSAFHQWWLLKTCLWRRSQSSAIGETPVQELTLQWEPDGLSGGLIRFLHLPGAQFTHGSGHCCWTQNHGVFSLQRRILSTNNGHRKAELEPHSSLACHIVAVPVVKSLAAHVSTEGLSSNSTIRCLCLLA